MTITLLSLVVWGWLNQNWIVAGLIILLLAGSTLTTWRWKLKKQQFYRIGDFVSVLFISMLVYFAVAHTQARPVFIILEWLPVFFLPVLLAQIYTVENRLPLGTLFYSMRKREILKTLDFKLPYAAICWLAAGAANDASLTYFVLSIAGFIGILWTVRSKNSSLLLWSIVIALSIGLSYWGQKGLRHLHGVIEEQAVEWFTEWRADPFKSMTSIGDIGELKLSDRIVFRAKADAPLLLMQASYDRYLGQLWLATQRVFSKQANFTPAGKHAKIKQLDVFQSLKRATVLALPAGTVNITGLEGTTLQYTGLGAVKVTEAPDYMNYQIHYTGLQVDERREFDLQVPVQHEAWLVTIRQALNIEEQSPLQIAQAITRYFQEHYYYSLFSGKESDADSALKEFITQRKAGHCEYFAVASVFLLRSYGIPARLANGYALQEYSESEQLYTVRRRHAHAWAIAQIDGYWQAVDATPSQWLNMEEEQADLMQPVYDFFSRYYFKYKQWRYQKAQVGSHNTEQQLGLLAVVLLLLLITWRLFVSRRAMVQLQAKPNKSYAVTYPGQDSELFDIEKSLANTESSRLPNESVIAWAKRIDNQALMVIIQLHYRYRFDNERFTAADRAKLKQAVAQWLM